MGNRRWTEEEEKRLVQIAENPWNPYNYYKAATELKRSVRACVDRYWLIKDRWAEEDKNG